MNKELTDNARIVVTFGMHIGTEIRELPVSYLLWGANQHEFSLKKEFELELKRRGASFQPIELSGHSINRASLIMWGFFRSTSERKEGLHSWMCRYALLAIKHGIEIIQDRKDEHDQAFELRGFMWCFWMGAHNPVLKSVMTAKGKKGK